MTPIYEAYGQIVDLLRNQKPEEARKVLEDVLPKQADILVYHKEHLRSINFKPSHGNPFSVPHQIGQLSCPLKQARQR